MDAVALAVRLAIEGAALIAGADAETATALRPIAWALPRETEADRARLATLRDAAEAALRLEIRSPAGAFKLGAGDATELEAELERLWYTLRARLAGAAVDAGSDDAYWERVYREREAQALEDPWEHAVDDV